MPTYLLKLGIETTHNFWIIRMAKEELLLSIIYLVLSENIAL